MTIKASIHRLAVKAINQSSADVRAASLAGSLTERGHERGYWREPKLPPYRDMPIPDSVARQRELAVIAEFIARRRAIAWDVAAYRRRYAIA
jgi:hypothetical protein